MEHPFYSSPPPLSGPSLYSGQTRRPTFLTHVSPAGLRNSVLFLFYSAPSDSQHYISLLLSVASGNHFCASPISYRFPVLKIFNSPFPLSADLGTDCIRQESFGTEFLKEIGLWLFGSLAPHSTRIWLFLGLCINFPFVRLLAATKIWRAVVGFDINEPVP